VGGAGAACATPDHHYFIAQRCGYDRAYLLANGPLKLRLRWRHRLLRVQMVRKDSQGELGKELSAINGQCAGNLPVLHASCHHEGSCLYKCSLVGEGVADEQAWCSVTDHLACMRPPGRCRVSTDAGKTVDALCGAGL